MSVVVQQSRSGTGCAVQVLWWLFIGWWAGAIWLTLAWLLGVSIVGLPLAVKMFNRVPQVIALRDSSNHQLTITVVEGVTVVSGGSGVPQVSILVRILYLILVGWWLSALWILAAYAVCYTLIGLPLGFWMFDRVPAIVSPYRS